MFAFLIRRLLLLIPILLGVSILVFGAVHLVPGDPAQIMLGERATAESLARVREQLGLDRPLYEQYFNYVGRAVQGDLGRSISSNSPVLSEIAQKFPATIELAFAAMLIATVFGVSTGILAAVYRNSWIDNLSMVTALTGVSMPIFWLGLVLMLVFSANLNWLPFSGRLDISFDIASRTNFYLIDSLLAGDWRAFKDAVMHLILPAVTLATVPMAIIARMTRASMLEVLHQDYIRTAKAKGVGKFRVVMHHALRNAAIPIATITGFQLGMLLSGAVITERVFAWPGLGSYGLESVFNRDFPALQGCVLTFALTFVLVNLLVDFSYFFLDPRIRDAKAK